MNINWFTVIAQVINFLILVWLLKKFLYKPVLDAIGKREQNIVSKIEDANKTKDEAKRSQDEFTEKNKKFDAEKSKMLETAIADTNNKKDKLMEDARKEADLLKTKAGNARIDEQQQLNKELSVKTQQEVFGITRKVLADLSSATFEEQATAVFISRLQQLDAAAKKQFKDAFKAAQEEIVIRTAFELPDQHKTSIQSAVDETLENKARYIFKVDPNIIGGIELNVNGYKFSWSISSYIRLLQKIVADSSAKEIPAAPETKKPVNEKKGTMENVHETASHDK